MARIKVEDLPNDMKVSKEEMKQVFGGQSYKPTMLGRGESGGAVHGGLVPQSIVISDPDQEEAMFFAPEELKS